MPSAAKDEIIDLTDIVEEGHPETPNLKTAKPSAATDETLDDLDLEREIDQIFADLGPPERDGQGGASGKKGEPDTDTLDLDGLFEDKGDKASEASDGTEGTSAGDDSSLDFAEDFDKLFDEEAQPKQKNKQDSDASTEAAPRSEDAPDWLEELDGLGLSEAKSETAGAPTDTSTDVSPNIPDAAAADSEMKADTDLEDVPQTEPEPVSEPATALKTDQGTIEVLEDVSSIVEKTANEDLVLDEVSTPEAALPESVLQRLQELEDRFSALEQREPPQIDVPEPDLDGLLVQMDQRIDERVGSRVDSVQRTVDGMAEQTETAVAKVVDAELAKLSASMSVDVEQRLKERLEESFAEHLEKRLDEYKASILKDIEQRLASAMNELKQGNGEQPEDPQIAELAAVLDERLETLRAELGTELRRELTDEMDKAVPLAAARIIREEIQAMSQEEKEAEQ